MNIPRAETLITKTDKVRQALREEKKFDALRIAHTFRHLGEHKVTIQRGWDAYQNPRFAKSLGRDPQKLIEAAFDALTALYGET